MQIEMPITVGDQKFSVFLDVEVSDPIPSADLCPTCFLPSMVAWDVVALAPEGLTPLMDTTACTHCSPELFEIEED